MANNIFLPSQKKCDWKNFEFNGRESTVCYQNNINVKSGLLICLGHWVKYFFPVRGAGSKLIDKCRHGSMRATRLWRFVITAIINKYWILTYSRNSRQQRYSIMCHVCIYVFLWTFYILNFWINNYQFLRILLLLFYYNRLIIIIYTIIIKQNFLLLSNLYHLIIRA